MKKLSIFFLFWGIVSTSYATHVKGGTIRVARATSTGLTYSMTVYLLIDERSGSAAAEGQSSVSICTGENGQTITAFRQARRLLSQGAVSLNTYQVQYTYATPNTFTVSVALENRGDNISNFNAINSPFYIQTTFSANLVNSTPTFNEAIGTYFAATRQVFTGDFQATDTDGDSLVYRIDKSKTTRSGTCSAQPIDAYLYPNEVTREGTFSIQSKTGILTWNAPTQIGQYTFVVKVEEWRNGLRISESWFETTLPVGDFGGTPVSIPPFEFPETSSGPITGIDRMPTSQLLVIPSIAHQRINVVWRGLVSSTAVFQLIDMTGRVLSEYRSFSYSPIHEHSFDTTQLSTGTYLVRINADRVATSKFVKQ